MSNPIGFISTSRVLASETGVKNAARRVTGPDPKTSSDELPLKIKIRAPFVNRIVNFCVPESRLKSTHNTKVNLVSDRSRIPQEQHHLLHCFCKSSKNLAQPPPPPTFFFSPNFKFTRSPGSAEVHLMLHYPQRSGHL